MQVTFVLPGFSPVPIGGFAVVYEYANQLASLGHEVDVVHSRHWLPNGRPLARLRSRVRAEVRDIVRGLPADGQPGWFPLDPLVHTCIVPRIGGRELPKADAVIATSWETAGLVSRLPSAALFYLIQHYEDWAGPVELVDATWRLPLEKIVISRWLLDVAHRLDPSAKVDYVPNGIDARRFRVITPIGERSPVRVGMLHHRSKWKGTQDGLEALSLVRNEFPGLDVTLFGTVSRPRLPSWATYVRTPSPNELVSLYNSFAIFVHPSWAEGWPLPPAEAMASGCALVAAGNAGVRDYAVDGENALLTPVQQPAALGAAIARLLSNDSLRQRLATAGHQTAARFSWEESARRLEAVLQAGVSRAEASTKPV